MIHYRRSGDTVTDRIISEFPDFAGFDETKPPLRDPNAVDTGEEFGRDTVSETTARWGHSTNPRSKKAPVEQSSQKKSTKPRKRAASPIAAAEGDEPQRTRAAARQEPQTKSQGGTRVEPSGLDTRSEVGQLLVCPRCKQPLDVEQRFYGPCMSCREQLRKIMPPPPDRVHFVDAKRQDGAHIIDVKTCSNRKCRRKACVEARDERVSRARDSEGAA